MDPSKVLGWLLGGSSWFQGVPGALSAFFLWEAEQEKGNLAGNGVLSKSCTIQEAQGGDIFLKHNDFIIQVLSAQAFRSIRRSSSVSAKQLADSTAQLRGTVTNSWGGSKFAKTQDGAFIVKTLTKKETKILRSIAPALSSYLAANRSSFLVPILGAFTIRLPKRLIPRKVSFLIMENAANVSGEGDWQIYDLKGSVFGRKASANDKCLKDIDFLNDLLKSGPLLCSVGPFKHIAKQLETDANFLCAQGIVDYSLLVAMCSSSSHASSPMDDGCPHASSHADKLVIDNNTHAAFFRKALGFSPVRVRFGIIDILCRYTPINHASFLLRQTDCSGTCDTHAPTQWYTQRFRKRVIGKAFAPAPLVASCDVYGVIKIWDVMAGKCMHTLQHAQARALFLLASRSQEQKRERSAVAFPWLGSVSPLSVRLWDTESGVCVREMSWLPLSSPPHSPLPAQPLLESLSPSSSSFALPPPSLPLNLSPPPPPPPLLALSPPSHSQHCNYSPPPCVATVEVQSIPYVLLALGSHIKMINLHLGTLDFAVDMPDAGTIMALTVLRGARVAVCIVTRALSFVQRERVVVCVMNLTNLLQGGPQFEGVFPVTNTRISAEVNTSSSCLPTAPLSARTVCVGVGGSVEVWHFKKAALGKQAKKAKKAAKEERRKKSSQTTHIRREVNERKRELEDEEKGEGDRGGQRERVLTEAKERGFAQWELNESSVSGARSNAGAGIYDSNIIDSGSRGTKPEAGVRSTRFECVHASEGRGFSPSLPGGTSVRGVRREHDRAGVAHSVFPVPSLLPPSLSSSCSSSSFSSSSSSSSSISLARATAGKKQGRIGNTPPDWSVSEKEEEEAGAVSVGGGVREGGQTGCGRDKRGQTEGEGEEREGRGGGGEERGGEGMEGSGESGRERGRGDSDQRQKESEGGDLHCHQCVSVLRLQDAGSVNGSVCPPVTSLLPLSTHKLLLTGSSLGSLYLRKPDSRKHPHTLSTVQVVKNAHTGPVTALTELADLGGVVSGGRDGSVKVWRVLRKKEARESARAAGGGGGGEEGRLRLQYEMRGHEGQIVSLVVAS